jgi:hypothetical protein
VKTWSEFIRGAAQWAITIKDSNHEIVPYRKNPKGGESWVEDRGHKTIFPSGTTLEQVINRMIAIMQAAERK